MRGLPALLTLFLVVFAAANTNLRHSDDLEKEVKAVLTCSLCRQFMDSAFQWLEEGHSIPELIDKLSVLCVDLGIFSTERVCRGYLEINVETWVWIVEEKNQTAYPLNPETACGFILYDECQFDTTPFEWTLDLSFLGLKPTPDIPQVPPQGSPTYKIIQFTDVHVDPNYMPGYNAVCGEPMCCRFDQGIPVNASDAAGYWGDYRNCDNPVHSFQNLVAEAATRHQDVAYVIFTGDIVDHGVWDTGITYNENLMTLVSNEFQKNFPNVPVLSTFGNHEAHPCNVFSDPFKTEVPANISQGWLYETAADLWGTWLPPETRPDILNGGRYAHEVVPGLVVIAINTMWCYNFNWWLMYDNYDPAGELVWLGNKLLELELAGKKAHILAHHPSGRRDCMHWWSIPYRQIIDRFENTLVTQFHGHTHNDHFHVYYDLADPSRATNIAFTAGSGTPYSDINPNYRVYTIDAATFRILDHETWYYNLTEANLGGALTLPNWQKLYSFNEAYGTTAVFPGQMDSVVHRMVNDTALQYQYFRYYVKDGDAKLEEGCDTACLQDLVCDTVITVQNDLSKCNELYPPAI